MEYLERRKKLISKNPFTLGISFKGKSKEQKYTDSVGPQTYQPVRKCTTPSYSFRYKPDDNRCETPGPGSYSIAKREGRFTSFSTANRFETICQSVGPADYQLQEQAHLLRNNYKFSMGKSARTKYNQNNLNPGPGTYDIRQDITKSMNQTITFSQSFKQEKQVSNSPGPGSYNNIEMFGKKGHKIPLAKLIEQRDQSPGPGDYNINKQKREKYRMIKFMKGKRDCQTISNSPGPGSYSNEINNLLLGVSYSIGERRRIWRKCQTPGPGTYF